MSLLVRTGDAFRGLLPGPISALLEHIERSQVGRRLTRGAFWSLVGLVTLRGLNMASMVFVARILGKIEFGEVGVIQSTMGMVQAFAGFGLGFAATKYVAEFRGSNPTKAGRIISFCNLSAAITGGLMALGFFLSAPWLAKHALAAPHLTGPLRVSSLLLFMATLTGTQYGILAGLEAFKSLARIGFLSGSASVPLIVGGAWLFGVDGAVWGMILATCVNWAMNHHSLKAEAVQRGVKISWDNCWQERAVLWDFGLPAILGGTMYSVAAWAASVMLVNRPGGYGEMGYYNAANQWFSALLFLPGVLGQAAVPVLSEQIGKKQLGRTRKILLYSVKLNIAFMAPMVLIGCLLSPWFMKFYGNDFEVAWGTLAVTLFTAGIVAIQAPPAQIVTASGRMWAGTITSLSYSIAFVAASAAFVNWGSLGIAVARGIAYCLYAFCSFKLAFFIIRTLENQAQEVNQPSV
ncbi:MAG: oligosaccharide flippase family protein [Syntrophorhabdales bacterium]|jgi:O-antigen/teichoic acid export membrane protein